MRKYVGNLEDNQNEGNFFPVEYLTENFENIQNIQIYVYVHRKSLEPLTLDLEQCSHNAKTKIS